MFLIDRVILAIRDTGHALDTFIQDNESRLLFLPFNGPDRALSGTDPAHLAFFNVNQKIQQGRASFGRAFLVDNVGFVFMPKILERGQNRIGTGLPQPAQGPVLDHLTKFL